MKTLLLSALLLTAAGCRNDKDETTDSEPVVTDDSGGAVDADGDGYGAEADCDDSSAAIHPGAEELCNGVDDDCDGTVDVDAGDAGTWYADGDLDGWGNELLPVVACEQPPGHVAQAGDCDDGDPDFYPGAPEDDCADPSDYNCDGSVGYEDGDGDGYAACEECDDANRAVNPSATEICDDVDNDCDGEIDVDAVDAATWYQDGDNDGYGVTDGTTESCEQPTGYADNTEDCDDADGSVNPAAAELCDTVDNDCDGETDEDDADDAATWYLDADGDGYGLSTRTTQACAQPSGYADNADDCDDNEALAWTGASESCDGVDNDCDSSTDEGALSTWYLDYDGDGYGNDSQSAEACSAPTSLYVASGGDCDDSDADYSPGATEGCDGEDYNCDGSVDNDADGDGYADLSCGGTDCDDSDANVTPEINGGCALGTSCLDVLNNGYSSGDGTYTIDPDGYGTGEDPIDVYCDMNTSGGGWTLCASLTKGYVPSHMLYDEDLYAFQARLNGDNNYVYETDAPGSSTAMWNNSESLNYGQFCRLMGTSNVTDTWIQAKLFNYANNYGSSHYGRSYDTTKSAVYSGNLYLQWFTNTSASRSFTQVSGDTLYVQSNSNGYGGNYVTPNIGWSSGNQNSPYTHSTTPWGGVSSSSSCVGCTNSGSSGYRTLPYGQTTILNDMAHSFWSGIPNIPYGWSDCTANGNCDYHESGYGVWLFWVR
ncbi:MAG: hypothetical protein H6741_20405 [Alphaproteobacteria bacterium]|nr:hypothetical protein [Alphaproteobacteria bacterium]